ncbi:MAG TPA: cadherin-like beta sandwich domain-containing protein, partial [Acholeplasma sp.]|nr:cadherin-like beta sandwich domain-containing protein [Acholeplasma sp.]
VIPTYEDNRTIYDIKVPREVYLQKINYEPGHMNQTINKTYSNLTLSPGGTKTFTIIVTAEDGKTIHYYDIVITQKNSDNKINSIIINDNEVDLTKETKVYDLGTFSYTNRILSLDVILNDAFAKVLINDVEFLANTYELKTNETQFTIRAKAEDGSLGELYTFKYKLNEASDDNLLDSLSVSANGIELLTDMDLLNGNKQILLPSDLDITEVLVKASATKNNKSISLVVGLNDVVYPTQNINTTLKLNVQSDGSINQQFSIYVKSENNLTKTYTITIIKGSQLSDNNEIAKIELYDQNNNLITEFSEFDAMSINVPYEITHATLVVYTLDTRAIIEGSLFKALTVDAATLISFKVKAESGKLSDTYTVSIYRQKANTNANLENLEVLDKNGVNLIEFDPNKNLYEIYVPRGETSFEIKYVLGHKYQTVTGKVGNITANNGEVNTYSIFVTAQDTSITNEYIVKITVKNTDNSIYSITFGEETLTVNSSFTNYVFMDVPFEISELPLDFITDQFATKVGNGLKTLKVGKNTFEIYAISELGQAGQILTVEITRLPGDSDATLKNLTVYDVTNQNMLIFDQTFDKNNYFYTITLDGKTYGSIQDIEINAEASSVYATITGLGNHKVTELSGEIDAIYSILVTAQDGSTITYQIRIIKKKDLSNEKGIDLVEVYTLDNVLIKSFDTFNQMILEVPYEISSVKVIVHTIDPNSTVSGELVAALTPNVVKQITFKVVAENQTESSPYSVIITRKPASQNAYLDALYVYDENEVNLISFDKETYTYNLDLTRDYEKLRFEYELGHENQIVTGTIGWVTLHEGMNKFQIFVTAQDTVTKKTYTVNVNVINKDNTIKTITFGNQTIEVREDQTQYIFDDVAYQVSELNLDFVTDSYATKKGAGQKSLKVGENIFEIYAIAENGMVGKVYEIIINRLPGDSDTTLKSLEVFDLTNQVILSFDAPFHPETSIYTITLEEGYTLNQLEIKAEATSSHASILGLGVKQVIPYQNVIFEVYQITVKAEDNSTRTYEIRLLQAQSKPEPNKDYDVFDIELIGSDQINYFEGLFEPLVGLQTSVTVPYHVTSVQLQAIISEGASLVGRNNLKVYALTPGKSITIEVQAKAENGDLNPIIYTIEVTRLEGSKDNELKELKILEIENDILHTEFDLTQNYIKVYIEKTTKNIEIKALGPENAKVTYGDVVISSTKKLHHIFVQSEDLSIEPRIYTIEIDTVKDSNASIQDLIVTTLDGDILNISPAFNPTIKKYALDITGLDITHIDVNVIPNSPYASVLNDGVLQLTTKEGKSTETFVFTVVAEDGITKETIELTVTREVDPKDDVTIHDISLIGNDSKNYLGYQNALNRFESHIYEYEITVPYAVHTLNLNIYNMNGATSNKSGLFTLKDPSEVTVIEFIMVSLSGKTSKPYKITVHRELPSTDNTLKDLKINGKSIENFDSENLYYEIVVDELKVDSIIIEGVKNDSTALISGDGEKEIKPGTNTFVVEVTAEDGSKRNYIVTVKSQSFDTSLK